MNTIEITDQEFSAIQSMIFDCAGISLQANKKSLVVGRLSKRLDAFQLNSFSDYLLLLAANSHPEEQQVAIDLLTTNETYFFREPKHFEFLKNYLSERPSNKPEFRAWSAACSYGQEPYSIAMVAADVLKYRKWELYASDISTDVLNTARKGLYPIEQAEKIPSSYLKKYCLKGVDQHNGRLLIDKSLRDAIKFMHINLNAELPKIGEFDVIFLRNVMLYFNGETKRNLVNRLKTMLKPGGYLIISHSESLSALNTGLTMTSPSIYQNRL